MTGGLTSLTCSPGKVTIYDGAMFHKAKGFFIDGPLMQSLPERMFKLRMFDHVYHTFQISAGLPWNIMVVFFFGGGILALLWIPGKMQQQQQQQQEQQQQQQQEQQQQQQQQQQQVGVGTCWVGFAYHMFKCFVNYFLVANLKNPVTQSFCWM